MTTLTLEQQAKVLCEYCRLDLPVELRPETGEYVHSLHGFYVRGGQLVTAPNLYGQYMCGAHELRKKHGQPL